MGLSMISLIRKLKNNKFANYVFFALVTSGINVGAYMLFYNCIYANILISNIFAYTISIITSFIINKKLVFKNDNKNFIIQLILYLMVKVVAFGIDSLVLIGLHRFFTINNFLAKLIANTSTTISNYTLNNKVVFRNKKDGN